MLARVGASYLWCGYEAGVRVRGRGAWRAGGQRSLGLVADCLASGLLDTTCCWGVDFSALLRGKIGVLVGRVYLASVNAEAPWACGCPMIRGGSSACDSYSNVSCV